MLFIFNGLVLINTHAQKTIIIKWKHFRRYWSPVNSRTNASDAELWCFLWTPLWINGWVNNREAGNLRRHRARYDVTVTHKQDYFIFKSSITIDPGPIVTRSTETGYCPWGTAMANIRNSLDSHERHHISRATECLLRYFGENWPRSIGTSRHNVSKLCHHWFR